LKLSSYDYFFEHGMQQGIMSKSQFQECQELLLKKNNYNIVLRKWLHSIFKSIMTKKVLIIPTFNL
jgi:hypothetical protein